MKTAVLISNGQLATFEMEKTKIITFTTEDRQVIGVEDELLTNSTHNYLFLWCLNKQVNRLYLSSVKPNQLLIFNAIGVAVKVEEELQDDFLYLSFVL